MATKYDADSIVVIKGDRERILQSPNMYIPNRRLEGAIHCIFEIIDNSIDELTIKNSVGNKLDVIYDEKTKKVIVEDNGRGIPHEKLYDSLTVLSASGKFNNSDIAAYRNSGGSYGFGQTIVLVLSDEYTCTSNRDGKALTYTFKNGLKTSESSTPTKKHGTRSEFIINKKIIDTSELTAEYIRDRLEEKSFVFPSLQISFTVTSNGKEKRVYKYTNKTIADRIKCDKPNTTIYTINDTREITFLRDITDNKLSKDKINISLAFAYSENVLDTQDGRNIISYANTIKTYSGGTHVDGLYLGIQKYFKSEVIPKFRGKDKEINILPSDTISGITAFVVVTVMKPEFRGQEKTELSNPEVKYAVRDAVYDYLCNLKSTTQMVDFVKRVARGRMASKKTRKKDVSNAFSKDRLDKFKDIIQNLKTTDVELLLVEGDSAADNAAQARDPYNQAIYPIRRPANIFDQDTSSVEKLKTTFNDVLDICGLSVGDKCDPEKSTMNRILMLTDGDVDGDDIAISTVCLLAKHCKPLLDAGMVGRILPPAYAIPVGKGKKEYVRSQKEFFDWILKDFVKNHKVSFRGKEMSKKELRHFLEKNFNYDMEVDRLKDRYCCDPKFIEYLAWNYHGHQKDQKKSYWMNKLKPYPYLSIIMEKGDKGNILVLDGDYPGFDYLNLALDEYFDRHINRFKEMQKMNDTITGYTLDGKKDCTVYDVMHAMRSSIPGGKIERFKGLGELSPDEMRDLCMDKDKRTVAIFKFNDFKKDMDKINIMMSTKKEYVEARAKLIQATTLDWKNLDT